MGAQHEHVGGGDPHGFGRYQRCGHDQVHHVFFVHGFGWDVVGATDDGEALDQRVKGHFGNERGADALSVPRSR